MTSAQFHDTAPAPIAVFAFRRPDHLRRTIEALRDNHLAHESKLYVYCDAPRRDTEHQGVVDVRRYAERIDGFQSVELILRSENFGLARSITTGVGEIVARHGRVIVVEDDLVTSPHFLTYMNDGLRAYADDSRVASIHGYVYPVDRDLPRTFFQRGADCWGWGTWARAWAVFNPDAQMLLDQLERRDLISLFDMDGSFSFSGMLRDYIAGSNDSWAVRWHASTFLANMLTLYPGHSLVHNIGFDASGEHCGTSDAFGDSVYDQPIKVERQPIVEDQNARSAFVDYFRATHSIPRSRSNVGHALWRGLRNKLRELTRQ